MCVCVCVCVCVSANGMHYCSIHVCGGGSGWGVGGGCTTIAMLATMLQTAAVMQCTTVVCDKSRVQVNSSLSCMWVS